MSRAGHVEETFGGWELDTHAEIDGERAAVYTHSESKIRVACIPMDGDRGLWRVQVHPPADMDSGKFARIGFRESRDAAEHLAKTEMRGAIGGVPPCLEHIDESWGVVR